MFERRKKAATDPKGPEPLGEILSRLFTARGWGRKQDRLRLEQAWAEAVGPEYAPQTRLNGLPRGAPPAEATRARPLQAPAPSHKRATLEPPRGRPPPHTPPPPPRPPRA